MDDKIKDSKKEIISQSGSFTYRGRLGQIGIYLGKLLRMFLYQNDWKVIPMAALVAGMVALVIRDSMFQFVEGTLEGAFALVFVGIWNGCFNSIQVICRERSIIKREHRSGMHISSYIMAHMIYQALLCLFQSGLTIYICSVIGVQFPAKGLFTPWIKVDIGISMFLVTYAADMMALWISSLARSTTTAMTVMPFILIFQLVFSGGIFELPEWSAPLSNITISHSGMKCLAAQGDYNNLPMVTGWNSLMEVRNEEITVQFTVGDALDFMSTSNDKSVEEFRNTPVQGDLTAGNMLMLMNLSPEMQVTRTKEITIKRTVDEIINQIGREKVREIIRQKTAESARNDEYETSKENIGRSWGECVAFIFVFAALAVITLEFIDKDKR